MIQPDEIIRSRRKTLAITVDSFGRLIVRAPLRCSERRIFSFLEEKEGWIVRKIAEKKGSGIQLPPENLDGYTFCLLGKACKIHVVSTTKVGYDSENHTIYLPENNPQERLVKWLKENAKRIFTDATRIRAEEMGVSYHSVSISSATTKWGSCTGDNRLRFSYRLLYAPKEVIDYVIVHELCHTLHHDHSSAFWAAVASVLPDYQRKRKWLKDRGALLKIL